MNMKNLVYTDDKQRDFRLKDCNGYEIYKIQYRYEYRWSDEIRYQVYKKDSYFIKYFDTLKEAREYAKTH